MHLSSLTSPWSWRARFTKSLILSSLSMVLARRFHCNIFGLPGTGSWLLWILFVFRLVPARLMDAVDFDEDALACVGVLVCACSDRFAAFLFSCAPQFDTSAFLGLVIAVLVPLVLIVLCPFPDILLTA